MADRVNLSGFESRNDILKRYKSIGKYGWMHLILARRRADGKHFLRLKRYMNWFSIPDEKTLNTVQNMLWKGARELGWAYDTRKEVKIREIRGEDDIQGLQSQSASKERSMRLCSIFLKKSPK